MTETKGTKEHEAKKCTCGLKETEYYYHEVDCPIYLNGLRRYGLPTNI